ncbi:acyl-CoA thioesterase [Ammoniphilus resinae]|uniref:Acyl-CoA thioester hydrolase n=1 Tax=Ammoniphilus resinae TaxID=861532 RepID=A0ABS4GW95_9BACL|nr:thioesterase family protein [Ammoniphilus resinae]MBP1934526.1 acyl-CoA thioester hydrolase [Ammoniphilus resinae]
MFRSIIRPRVSETDGAGHINNTTVPVWFEAGREGIFKIFNPNLSFTAWRSVIVSLSVDYIHQMYLGKDVEVRTWIQRIGNKSFVIYEEIHQGGILCAKGTATYVNFNPEKQISEPIPESIRNELEKHLFEST